MEETTDRQVTSQSDKAPINVLIVEDDETFRDLLAKIMESKNFHVRVAENGLVAKTIMSLNPGKFDLVLTDIRMPEMDGIQFLQSVHPENEKTRFIVMTGFSEILEAKQAYEIGADEFLSKPFKMQDLFGAIERAFRDPKKNPSEPEVEEDEFSFCKIHVDEFTSASRLISDIYIRLAEHKFIKVGREGTEIQVQRIQTYKEKKVEYFYVLVKDFQKYAGLTLRLAQAVSSNRKITRDQKLRLYKHTGEILVNQAFLSDLKPEAVESSQNIISNTLNVLGEEPDLFDLVLLLKSHSDSIYAHSVAVSVYSCLIAKKLGWTSQQTLMKLSLCGLFHDIGMKEIPNSVLSKPRRLLTADEIALYESHPQRGKNILSSYVGFPSDVAQMAFQHHENCLGTGYPLGTDHQRIHPLAKIIHLTDEFCHTCQKLLPNGPDAWKSALRELWETKASELDPHALKALMEILNYPVPTPLLKLKKTA